MFTVSERSRPCSFLSLLDSPLLHRFILELLYLLRYALCRRMVGRRLACWRGQRATSLPG